MNERFDPGKVIDVLKQLVTGDREQEKMKPFTHHDALEKFRAIAAAGSEGQVAAASFTEGSTVILNQYPPGTIFREEYEVNNVASLPLITLGGVSEIVISAKVPLLFLKQNRVMKMGTIQVM